MKVSTMVKYFAPMYADMMVVVLAVTQAGFTKTFERDGLGMPDLSEIASKTVQFFMAQPMEDRENTMLINLGINFA